MTTTLIVGLSLFAASLCWLLWGSYRYHHDVLAGKDAWLKLRIQAEMGETWMQRFGKLPMEQLWLQFTYDIAHPSLADWANHQRKL